MSNDENLEDLILSSIMSTESGRDFAWLMLNNANVFNDTFDPDPIKHAFNAGKRSVGLQLERDIKQAAPEQYLRMLKEHLDE